MLRVSSGRGSDVLNSKSTVSMFAVVSYFCDTLCTPYVVSLKKGKDRLHNTKSPSFITQGG